MSGIRNVLFLCAGDEARGLMAEAILNREGAGRFRAFSAGLSPVGTIHPAAEALLRKLNHSTGGLHPKGLAGFTCDGAPVMDFVFTVSEDAAENEHLPLPGVPLRADWSLPDPLSGNGSEAERALAVADAYRMLCNRIGVFVNLPMTALDRLSLQQRLSEIGRRH
ncbi:MAG TPA: hypothetical protein VM661_15330 [Candidatus Sulfotelmatobacter sp.]|jgi:protein-tyrosine-phosphatase|nr:hypothetical protein [Candidatus Sulfotelmatobacter sp.]